MIIDNGNADNNATNGAISTAVIILLGVEESIVYNINITRYR